MRVRPDDDPCSCGISPSGGCGRLTGCTPLACPAIGWSNIVTVQLRGDTSSVAQVQLCVDGACGPAEDVDMTGPLGMVSLSDHEGGAWAFHVDMGFPSEFTVRSLAADGSVLSDSEVAPEWVRVGGSAHCGGPAEATVEIVAVEAR